MSLLLSSCSSLRLLRNKFLRIEFLGLDRSALLGVDDSLLHSLLLEDDLTRRSPNEVDLPGTLLDFRLGVETRMCGLIGEEQDDVRLVGDSGRDDAFDILRFII